MQLGEQGQNFGETFRIRAVANPAATRWEPTLQTWPREGARIRSPFDHQDRKPNGHQAS